MKPTKRITAKDEFRKHRDEYKHPHYVYEKDGNFYKSIQITHKRPNDSKFEALHKNPDPKDKSDAFISNKITIDRTNRYKKAERGWRFDKRDLPAVEQIKKRGERLNGGTERHKVKGNYGTPQRSNGSISRPARNVNPRNGGKK